MKGRYQRAMVVGVGVVATAWLLTLLLRPREPNYQGKCLSEWLEDVNQAGSLEKTKPASVAIRAMGTNALPFLFTHIEHQDSRLKIYFRNLASKHSVLKPLLKFPFLEPDWLCSPSLWAVKELGGDASPLIPEFARLLGNDDMPSWCGELGLWAVGPPATDALENLCRSTNEHVRATAALVLARVRVAEASDKELRLRESEVERGLRPIGGAGDGWSWGWEKSSISGRMRFGLGSVVTEDVIGALVLDLRHKDAHVRRASAEALKGLGNQAHPAISALTELLKDENSAVREAAAEALKKIDPEADAKAGIR